MPIGPVQALVLRCHFLWSVTHKRNGEGNVGQPGEKEQPALRLRLWGIRPLPSSLYLAVLALGGGPTFQCPNSSLFLCS